MTEQGSEQFEHNQQAWVNRLERSQIFPVMAEIRRRHGGEDFPDRNFKIDIEDDVLLNQLGQLTAFDELNPDAVVEFGPDVETIGIEGEITDYVGPIQELTGNFLRRQVVWEPLPTGDQVAREVITFVYEEQNGRIRVIEMRENLVTGRLRTSAYNLTESDRDVGPGQVSFADPDRREMRDQIVTIVNEQNLSELGLAAKVHLVNRGQAVGDWTHTVGYGVYSREGMGFEVKQNIYRQQNIGQEAHGDWVAVVPVPVVDQKNFARITERQGYFGGQTEVEKNMLVNNGAAVRLDDLRNMQPTDPRVELYMYRVWEEEGLSKDETRLRFRGQELVVVSFPPDGGGGEWKFGNPAQQKGDSTEPCLTVTVDREEGIVGYIYYPGESTENWKRRSWD